MKIIQTGLIVAALVAAFVLVICLDWILEQPHGLVLLWGIILGIVIGVGTFIAIISSMFSSQLSREEEAAHRNHAVKVEPADFNPRGYKWS